MKAAFLNPRRFNISRQRYVTELSFELVGAEKVRECFEPHSHAMLEVISILEGSLAVECGSGSFIAEAGELLCFNPSEPHHGIINSEHPAVRYLVFNFDLTPLVSTPAAESGASVGGLLHSSLRLKNRVPHSELTECITDEIRELARLASRLGESGVDLVLYGRAAALVGLLLSPEITVTPPESSESLFVLSVREFVEANYTRKIEPGELPALLHFSRSHFCALFKKHFGEPFSNYLRDYRMQKALELLGGDSDERSTISEVASRVGFEDYGYFTHYFRKKLGLSPSDYVKNMKK